MYCLEVLKFIVDDVAKKTRGFKHVEYVHDDHDVLVFKTKQLAAQYYDKQPENRQMRSLNAHNTYTSDWHPDTKLKYRVVPYMVGLLP